MSAPPPPAGAMLKLTHQRSTDTADDEAVDQQTHKKNQQKAEVWNSEHGRGEPLERGNRMKKETKANARHSRTQHTSGSEYFLCGDVGGESLLSRRMCDCVGVTVAVLCLLVPQSQYLRRSLPGPLQQTGNSAHNTAAGYFFPTSI